MGKIGQQSCDTLLLKKYINAWISTTFLCINNVCLFMQLGYESGKKKPRNSDTNIVVIKDCKHSETVPDQSALV